MAREGCTAAHRDLESLADEVTDDVSARTSLLPGWTVGHLLTHLARNADGTSRDDPLLQLAGFTRAAAAMCERKVVEHKQVARLQEDFEPDLGEG
ncbi:MAG: maleylpyruvate isomerase N-terminal domain-containing protein [Mycobacteriales bacterium]